MFYLNIFSFSYDAFANYGSQLFENLITIKEINKGILREINELKINQY